MPELKTILRLNAGSCIGFGALFLTLPNSVAAFLGTPPAPLWLVGVLGTALIVNGLHLLHTSRHSLPSKYVILYFSGGDFAWVLSTVTLVVSGLWINHLAGQIVALVVAAFVGAMGAMQMLTCRAAGPDPGDDQPSHRDRRPDDLRRGSPAVPGSGSANRRWQRGSIASPERR